MGSLRSLLLLLCLTLVDAAVTIYHVPGQEPLTLTDSVHPASTTTAAAADYTGAAAYNPTVLEPPAVPDPKPNLAFGIQLQNGGTPGASIQQSGSFLGFSIEMSVANQVLGKNSTHIQVPFLNLMANLQQRSGKVHVRVGGNTQETAVLVDSLPDGKILQKDISQASNPTLTPPVDFTADLLYMMRNISGFVDVRWFLGIPWNDTSAGNIRLAVADRGQEILGEYLIGLQAGNEPDLYARHGHRAETYGPFDYVGEFSDVLNAMDSDSHAANRQLLIGPNLATGDWTPEQVWDTGFVDTYTDNLAFLAVEHYPTDNCAAQFNTGGTIRNAQDIFPDFLTHNSSQTIVQPYLNSTAYAQTKNKKFMMFETNTASCGGFAGISDSFGASLWGLDYAMQMAHSNFSGALMHTGGQNVFYNPFTPPPTNQSSFHQWTVGPIYYSALVMAEALGASNEAQIMDLNANSFNDLTPGYAIYEKGDPVRVALFNYMTDPSGASDYTASISIGGGETGQDDATPSSVKVKYLSAPSVSTKGNFTWAGQTFGGNFESDGRLKGDEDVQTVACDTTAHTCNIKVPAPGFALVFLSDTALTETAGGTPTTFATTAQTKTVNTASVASEVLATSNGHTGMKNNVGSTSKGSQKSGAVGVREMMGGVTMLGALVAGALVVGRALVR